MSDLQGDQANDGISVGSGALFHDLDANKQRSVSGAEWSAQAAKENAGRSVQEYLAVLDDAAFGAASPVTPTFISPSDPAAQWTGAHKGHAFCAYATTI